MSAKIESTELVPFDELKAQILVWIGPTAQIAVRDVSSNALALDTLRELKARLKMVEELRKEKVAPLNERVKAINSYAKVIEEPLLRAEAEIKAKMQKWAVEEEARREAERRRLEEERRAEEQKAEEERRRRDAEARLKAEEERKRLQAEADARAKELEEKRKAEADALAAFGVNQDPFQAAVHEADALAHGWKSEQDLKALEAKQEQERLEEQARLEREAKSRAAEFAAKQKELEALRPKNTRKEWKFEVVDPSAVPREYLTPDPAAIKAAVGAGIRHIPGVKIFEETIVVVR